MELESDARLFKAVELHKRTHPLWSFVQLTRRSSQRQLPIVPQDCHSTNGLRYSLKQDLLGYL